MTSADRKILFTALAFLAIVMKGQDTKSANASEQIQALAELIESYCANAAGFPTLASEGNAPAIDE